MATINLGAIKFNWKGAYNSSTSYAVDDVVSSGGNSYVCIQAHSNQAVGDATAYWNIMSAKGTNGTNGTNGTDLTSTLTAQGDIVYRDGSGLQRLGAGTSGQVLQTGGAGANPSWGTVSTKFTKFSHYTYGNRNSLSATNSDQSIVNWTTSFVKDSATSNLFITSLIPTHGSSQGSQQSMTKFVHSDNTTTEFFGSRNYTYTGNNNGTLIGHQGVCTGMKAGTYTLTLMLTSNGNNHNGQMVLNPNATDDNRYEFSSGAQSATGTAGSVSSIQIMEIE
jgi:hypothetical protein